jgi:hypothetical protein
MKATDKSSLCVAKYCFFDEKGIKAAIAHYYRNNLIAHEAYWRG